MPNLIIKILYALKNTRYKVVFLYKQLLRNLSLPQVKSTSKSVLLCNLTSSPPFPGFNQLVLWLLCVRYRLKGYKVHYLYCNSAMTLCPQATSYRNVHKQPPCIRCRATRSLLFSPFIKVPISLNDERNNHNSHSLKGIEYIHTLRHFFKRFHLADNEDVNFVEAAFKSSAQAVAQGLKRIQSSHHFDEVVVFNGIFYPEQTVRSFYKDLGLNVLSYEVGFTKLSFFLTSGLAPEYDFNYLPRALNSNESKILDQYLSSRFKGHFEMGFTKFWKNIEKLGPLEDKIKSYKKVVTLFTNSVYDTSTVFSNSAFEDLFKWLESSLDEFRNHPELLVIIRSHPDEFKDVPWEKNRVRKTQETIKEWLEEKGFFDLPNLVFIEPTNFMSSYDLIMASSFVMVYNSTVGLEALLMGKPVVLGGKPKYYRISYLNIPQSPAEYLSDLKSFINRTDYTLSQNQTEEARSFFYQLFFEAGGELGSYIKIFDLTTPGTVILKDDILFTNLLTDMELAKFDEQ